jgi:hypothetical protein
MGSPLSDMNHRQALVISCLRTGYTRATHRHIIEKNDIPDCPLCDVRLTTNHILWQCSETRNERDECGINSTVWKEGREGIKKLVKYIREIVLFHGI